MVEVTYKTPDQLPIMEEVTENTYALVEENGTLKRVSGSNLGGSGGIKTAVIKSSDYDDAITGVQVASAVASPTYECVNMTFEEAYETIVTGEPFMAVVQTVVETLPTTVPAIYMPATPIFDVPSIIVQPYAIANGAISDFDKLYWTADGVSIETPELPDPTA